MYEEFSIGLNGIGMGPLIESKDRVAESAEQDQTARKCSLILLYTHRKMNPRSGKARVRIKQRNRVYTLINHRTSKVLVKIWFRGTCVFGSIKLKSPFL